jgi:outer membrane immunogenic protein
MFRKILLSSVALVAVSGTAFAADLPSRSAPPVYLPPPPVFSWTGVYVGGQVGYQFGTMSNTLFNNPPAGVSVPLATLNTNGVVGGAHLGILAQTGIFVYGIEGDVEGASTKGSGTGFGGLISVSEREDVESSFRLRAGLAFDRALVYATGGLAIADFHNTYSSILGTDSDGHTRFGWTVGGGVAYAITNQVAVRVEYRYSDYGSTNDVLANSSGGLLQSRVHETDNAVRVGISYNFSIPTPPPAPVVAKY